MWAAAPRSLSDGSNSRAVVNSADPWTASAYCSMGSWSCVAAESFARAEFTSWAARLAGDGAGALPAARPMPATIPTRATTPIDVQMYNGTLPMPGIQERAGVCVCVALSFRNLYFPWERARRMVPPPPPPLKKRIRCASHHHTAFYI